jgi:hypothetical protein
MSKQAVTLCSVGICQGLLVADSQYPTSANTSYFSFTCSGNEDTPDIPGNRRLQNYLYSIPQDTLYTDIRHPANYPINLQFPHSQKQSDPSLHP